MKIDFRPFGHNRKAIFNRQTRAVVGMLEKSTNGWTLFELDAVHAGEPKLITSLSTLREIERQARAHFVKHGEREVAS